MYSAINFLRLANVDALPKRPEIISVPIKNNNRMYLIHVLQTMIVGLLTYKPF